jgi:hypothetical protein
LASSEIHIGAATGNASNSGGQNFIDPIYQLDGNEAVIANEATIAAEKVAKANEAAIAAEKVAKAKEAAIAAEKVAKAKAAIAAEKVAKEAAFDAALAKDDA